MTYEGKAKLFKSETSYIELIALLPWLPFSKYLIWKKPCIRFDKALWNPGYIFFLSAFRASLTRLRRERSVSTWKKNPLEPRVYIYAHPKNSKHLRSHSRAIIALDHSRLGLENKFLENKSGRNFLRSTGLLYKFLPTNLGVCKHLIWGETVLFIIQTSDRMRFFTIFKDKFALSQCSGRSVVGF